MVRDIMIRADGAVFPYEAAHAAKSNFFRGILDNGVVTGPPMENAESVRVQVAKSLGISVGKVNIPPLEGVAAMQKPEDAASESPDVPPANDPLRDVDDLMPSPDSIPDDTDALEPEVSDDTSDKPDIPDRVALENMTKADLDTLCRDAYGVELDIKRTKLDLIAQIEALGQSGDGTE